MLTILGVLSAASCPVVVRAQGEETAVRFQTADGVTLRGQFFAGTKKSACVLLLHELGDVSRDKDWRKLAQALHKDGFAVLQFHFRGHGRSMEVDPDLFWSTQYPANRRYIKSASREEIDFQRFDSNYHPYLINDIAAAKAYLDRKNDAGECNSSNLILFSSGRSGAMAAAWINSEMHRYRQIPPPFIGARAQLANDPEGADILCALFVNLSSQLGKRKLSLASALHGASRREKTPFVFICGSDDNVARDTEKAINPGGKLTYTGVTVLPNVKANDVERHVATDEDMHKDLLLYLKKVLEDRGNEWQDHNWQETLYFWRNPNLPASLIPFNQSGSNSPPVVGYDLFLPAR
jgi:pimeloyl-ACP methyl ester carboxylesterase